MSSPASSTCTSSAVTSTSSSSIRCAVSVSSRSRRGCMPKLIKDRAVVEDNWTLLRDLASLGDVRAAGPVIVLLGPWLAHRDAFGIRREVGLRIAPNHDPGLLIDR